MLRMVSLADRKRGSCGKPLGSGLPAGRVVGKKRDGRGMVVLRLAGRVLVKPARVGAALVALAVLVGGSVAGACEVDTREVRGQMQSGCFVDGQLEGSGTVTFADGGRYDGDFMRGLRDGQGVMVFVDGRRYEGAWEADRPHGEGVFTWPDGNRYEGGYRRGRREGQGVMTTQGGASRYQGGWFEDKEHGHGQRQFGDGREYVGDYERGRPNGRGVLTVEGVKFEGRFERGRLVGAAVMTLPDGTAVSGRMGAGGQFMADP